MLRTFYFPPSSCVRYSLLPHNCCWGIKVNWEYLVMICNLLLFDFPYILLPSLLSFSRISLVAGNQRKVTCRVSLCEYACALYVCIESENAYSYSYSWNHSFDWSHWQHVPNWHTHTHTHTNTQTRTNSVRCPEDTPLISHLIWCWKWCHMFEWTLYLCSLNSKWLG